MLKKVTLIVVSCHLLFLLFLLFAPVKITPPSKKPIAVRTLTPATQVKSQPLSKAPPQARAQPTSPKSSPPKPSSKPPPQKKIPSSKKPVAKESVPPPKKTPPAKLEPKRQEPLAKIEEKVYSKPRLQLDVPRLESSSHESPSVIQESVEEKLVAFFHASLNLPEFGEVKIQLTVKKDGTVVRLVVVEAESKKNRTYLEEHLPTLRLPLVLDEEKTFTLTFCNEI